MLIEEIMARMNHESSSSQTYGSVLMMMTIVFNATKIPKSMVNSNNWLKHKALHNIEWIIEKVSKGIIKRIETKNWRNTQT